MITAIVAGLAILRTYDPDAPIVTQAYILAIPGILFASVTTGTDAADLLALGWIRHPVYLCYYYETKTITELADVTGEGDKDLPVAPVILAPPR